MSEKCYKCGYIFNNFSYKVKQFKDNKFLGYACVDCEDKNLSGSKNEDENIHSSVSDSNISITNTNNSGYWNIRGRFSRMQYFLHWLGLIILGAATVVIFVFSGLNAVSMYGTTYGSIPLIGLILGFFGILTINVGNFTIMVKRFHDFNQSGWTALIIIIMLWILGFIFLPAAIFFNFIVTFCLFFIRGTNGSNMYGEDPVKR